VLFCLKIRSPTRPLNPPAFPFPPHPPKVTEQPSHRPGFSRESPARVLDDSDGVGKLYFSRSLRRPHGATFQAQSPLLSVSLRAVASLASHGPHQDDHRPLAADSLCVAGIHRNTYLRTSENDFALYNGLQRQSTLLPTCPGSRSAATDNPLLQRPKDRVRVRRPGRAILTRPPA
jgi:hypothetical protein